MILLLAASASLLTACGPSSAAEPTKTAGPTSAPPATASSTPSEAPSSPPVPTPSSPLPEPRPAEATDASAPPCQPANVQGVLDMAGGGTLDVARVPVILTNTGANPCELTGYSKVEFLDPDTDQPLGIAEYITGAPR